MAATKFESVIPATMPEKSVTVTKIRDLRSLDQTLPLYMLPTDPFLEEVLIPGFKSACNVDCMVGFFSSDVLASLAPGLATFIARSDNSFRLIVSPFLRPEDQVAIRDSLRPVEEIADRVLNEITITENLLQSHTLKCLSWLLREHRIEIKVALMKNALFHPKVWMFQASGEIVAVHGSSNVTSAGICRNIEQISIAKSWQDTNQHYIANKFAYEFERFWENKESNCIVIALPDAVRKRLLQDYHSKSPPTEDEFRTLYSRATGLIENTELYEAAFIEEPNFSIPSWLKYDVGPFEHQGRAVSSWRDAQFRGILEMATGSGKTITAMLGAYHLYGRTKSTSYRSCSTLYTAYRTVV